MLLKTVTLWPRSVKNCAAARPLGPARLVLTFVLLSALFLLALLAGMLRLLVLALVPAQ